jgi:hypothetical protein
MLRSGRLAVLGCTVLRVPRLPPLPAAPQITAKSVVRIGAALLAAAVLVLGAAGCGGKKAAAPTTTTTGPRRSLDPGHDAVIGMIRAVRSRDAPALWALLSKPTRRQLGPTFAAFRRRSAPALERDFRYWLFHPFREVVSERITGRFGLIAIASGPRMFAAPLRLERKQWKLDLDPGTLRILDLRPFPGSRSRVAQIAYEIHGIRGGPTAVLYADGVTLNSREYAGPGSATVFANLDSPLTRGRHNAVAFVTDGNDAAAKAWTFFGR